MATLTIRLLPYAPADGAHNMAADEALLDSAVAGTASLRFYEWSEPTLSLGYFQPQKSRAKDQRLARLPFVRRPTGGEAIVHHFDLTYALTLPAGAPWHGAEPWPLRMHRIVAQALVGLGVSAEIRQEKAGKQAVNLCFQNPALGDVLIGRSKVVGSAQRRRRRSMLQHGSILLTISPFAPLLPGIRELSGHGLTCPPVRDAVAAEFTKQTGWQLSSADWTDQERARIRELTLSRYTQDSWNCKR